MYNILWISRGLNGGHAAGHPPLKAWKVIIKVRSISKPWHRRNPGVSKPLMATCRALVPIKHGGLTNWISRDIIRITMRS